MSRWNVSSRVAGVSACWSQQLCVRGCVLCARGWCQTDSVFVSLSLCLSCAAVCAMRESVQCSVVGSAVVRVATSDGVRACVCVHCAWQRVYRAGVRGPCWAGSCTYCVCGWSSRQQVSSSTAQHSSAMSQSHSLNVLAAAAVTQSATHSHSDVRAATRVLHISASLRILHTHTHVVGSTLRSTGHGKW